MIINNFCDTDLNYSKLTKNTNKKSPISRKQLVVLFVFECLQSLRHPDPGSRVPKTSQVEAIHADGILAAHWCTPRGARGHRHDKPGDTPNIFKKTKQRVGKFDLKGDPKLSGGFLGGLLFHPSSICLRQLYVCLVWWGLLS